MNLRIKTFINRHKIPKYYDFIRELDYGYILYFHKVYRKYILYSPITICSSELLRQEFQDVKFSLAAFLVHSKTFNFDGDWIERWLSKNRAKGDLEKEFKQDLKKLDQPDEREQSLASWARQLQDEINSEYYKHIVLGRQTFAMAVPLHRLHKNINKKKTVVFISKQTGKVLGYA